MSTNDGKHWFILLRGKRYGPYSFATLVKAAERGDVDPEAGVWCLGWAEWRAARDVPGLFAQGPERETPDDETPEEMANNRDEDDHDKRAAEKAAPDPPVHVSDRNELASKLAEAPPLALWPTPPKSEPSSHGRANVRIVFASILAVLVTVVGAAWAANSLGIIRVTFMPL
jgi:uncharacterized protein DUF4339